MGNKNPSREEVARVEGRAPARTYAIRAREEASSPDVITDKQDRSSVMISFLSTQSMRVPKCFPRRVARATSG
ncbi:TBC1 domain family member 1 [Gossypium australe]|uniref:TBC1 domain family member 1 n=1 Tax=Gossypium australe TaxID=47621 RepID=A0A5B6VAH9_9ROSI|nr:TBC1 domain family member 1 [Gossypium australe]